MENNKLVSSGIGFIPLLTLVFVTLKLTDYIDWSWWWVLSPLWLPTVVVIGLILIPFLIIGLFGLVLRLFNFIANLFKR